VRIAKAKNVRTSKILNACGISSSTYYRSLEVKDDKDESDFNLIEKHFLKSNQKAGIRQLKMIIERREGLIFNKKKIARIKRKYKLETVIRRKNVYRRFAKKQQEHEVCANLLDRNFTQEKCDQVYSIDITQVKYNQKKAYIAAVKDLFTKEIVSKTVSHRIDINLTNKAIDGAIKKLSDKQKENLLIHSDQGFHFTHFSYRKKLEESGITQSMSRKGNCLDNAPIESFFGILKDHLELQGCRSIKDVEKEVTKKINYYNNERPQWGLKKMPPSEYRRHCLK
jgi:transposase InsO family protein